MPVTLPASKVWLLAFWSIFLLWGQVEGQWNSVPSLTETGQYTGGGPLFLVASVSSGKQFTVISSDSTFTNAAYQCRYVGVQNPAQSMVTIATYVDAGKLTCPFPEWGSTYGSAITSFSLVRNGNTIQVIGDEVEIYFLGKLTKAIAP